MTLPLTAQHTQAQVIYLRQRRFHKKAEPAWLRLRDLATRILKLEAREKRRAGTGRQRGLPLAV